MGRKGNAYGGEAGALIVVSAEARVPTEPKGRILAVWRKNCFRGVRGAGYYTLKHAQVKPMARTSDLALPLLLPLRFTTRHTGFDPLREV